MRCTSLILENVLHAHNMCCRPIENFLEASEVQKNHEKQHFLHYFWYLLTPFRVSIKLQKLPSFRVFLQKNIFMHDIGPEMFSKYHTISLVVPPLSGTPLVFGKMLRKLLS